VANTQLLITSVHKLYTASHSFSSPAVHKNCTSHSCLVASVKQYTCNHLQNSCSFTASSVPTCNLSGTWKDVHMTPLTHRSCPHANCCYIKVPAHQFCTKYCAEALSQSTGATNYHLCLQCTSTDAHCRHTCTPTSKYIALQYPSRCPQRCGITRQAPAE
jgi:hypothetical protein